MSDDISLVLGDMTVSGWDSIRVTRRAEGCPNDFDLTMTERYPGELSSLIVQPLEPCSIKCGNDLLLTGYVDAFIPSFSPGQHSIRVTGRGKCQDLVDCAAEWPGSQIVDVGALGVAQKLAQPYGITVTALCDTSVGFQQFSLIMGETAFDVIERVCRNAGVLAYEDVHGNLVLSRVGEHDAGSGFAEGVNIEKAQAVFSGNLRYSEYKAFLLSFDIAYDLGKDGNLITSVIDEGVSRHRRMVIIAEAAGGGIQIAAQRAQWEAARRMGRSFSIALTTDGWRDQKGALYAPNTLAPLRAPSLKIKGVKWLISEVSYLLDGSGTHAEITMMPPDAFIPQPQLLQPITWDIDQALNAPERSVK